MKAIGAVEDARAAGIAIAVDGDDLVWQAASRPPSAVLDALARHKGEIIALLRGGGWSAKDWQAFFDERAGVAEFDGLLPRPQADQALACCVAEWLNQHPISSPPCSCIACGGRDHAHDALLPYGIEHIGLAWVHSPCWPPWYADRKAQATVALAAMGIGAPRSSANTFGAPACDVSGGRVQSAVETRETRGEGGRKIGDQPHG